LSLLTDQDEAWQFGWVQSQVEASQRVSSAPGHLSVSVPVQYLAPRSRSIPLQKDIAAPHI